MGKLDEFYWHEALDRTDSVRELVYAILENHPVIRADDQLNDSLDKVTDALCELYQLIGQKMPERKP